MMAERVSDLIGSDPYPGDTLEKQEAADKPPFPMLPESEDVQGPQRYRFVFVNGEMHLSPIHGHEELLKHARADLDYEGPMATGEAWTRNDAQGYRHATWRVASNIALNSVYDVLAHCSQQVGWMFDGVKTIEGSRKLAGPTRTFWYRVAGEDVQIASSPLEDGQPINVYRGIAYVANAHPGLQDWANDLNLKIAEVPGGGVMEDKMKRQQDIEMWDHQDPDFEPGRLNADFEPGGPFSCSYPGCNYKPKTFGDLKIHMDGHEPNEDPIDDGHFPQIEDYDAPLPLRRNQPYPEMAWNGVQAHVMVMPNTRLASHTFDQFDLYSDLFGFEGNSIYGAFKNGKMVGYGVVKSTFDENEPEVLMIQSNISRQGVGTAILNMIKRHYSSFFSHSDTPRGEALMRKCGMINVWHQKWRYAAGSEPKDMIQAEVPFIYDIQQDKLELGYPGTSTHEIDGQFVPGSIVEGFYAPGGLLTIQTVGTYPFSIRHLCDVFYSVAPQMEITGVEQIEKDGTATKLAKYDLAK